MPSMVVDCMDEGLLWLLQSHSAQVVTGQIIHVKCALSLVSLDGMIVARKVLGFCK